MPESKQLDTGGFKEIIFILKGEEAWSKMKYESGVHRVKEFQLQRQEAEYILRHRQLQYYQKRKM